MGKKMDDIVRRKAERRLGDLGVYRQVPNSPNEITDVELGEGIVARKFSSRLPNLHQTDFLHVSETRTLQNWTENSIAQRKSNKTNENKTKEKRDGQEPEPEISG